ncbi:hypothetical protein P8452_61893 [Trifolium repens]|nr:hypothetical protein P8452_61893 [Trifolium repens]
MKGIKGKADKNDDSANTIPTNLDGRRKGNRTRIASTRLDGYITSIFQCIPLPRPGFTSCWNGKRSSECSFCCCWNGFDLLDVCINGPKEKLNSTVISQEDTISINHNWFNAYNLSWVWNLILRDYNEAKEYIEDIKDICDDFEGLCQRNLAANTGMNFYDFFTFISYFSLANLVLL